MNTRKKVLTRIEKIDVLARFGIARDRLEKMSADELRYALKLYNAVGENQHSRHKPKPKKPETRITWVSNRVQR